MRPSKSGASLSPPGLRSVRGHRRGPLRQGAAGPLEKWRRVPPEKVADSPPRGRGKGGPRGGEANPDSGGGGQWRQLPGGEGSRAEKGYFAAQRAKRAPDSGGPAGAPVRRDAPLRVAKRELFVLRPRLSARCGPV